MPDIVLELLKYLFLVVLYVFVARAVRAVYREMRPVAAAPATKRSSAPTSSRRPKKPPTRAAVVEGASKSGKSFELKGELTIGRADKCHIIIDDNYVSQAHARIYPNNGTFFVEDLGSTNGTYLNRKRITTPSELQRGDKLKIGKTVLEMQR